jgi:hypothetical protein
MSRLLQLISTGSILVLLGVTLYLSLPKYRQTAQAISHLLFRWFSILLASILAMRIVLIFDKDLVLVQMFVNSLVFTVTVIGITWSVAKYERTNKK